MAEEGGRGVTTDTAPMNPRDPILDRAEKWQAVAERLQAREDEIRGCIAAFFVHHGNNTGASLQAARDLAEGIRQILDREPLP
jgi:hypothetical protein